MFELLLIGKKKPSVPFSGITIPSTYPNVSGYWGSSAAGVLMNTYGVWDNADSYTATASLVFTLNIATPGNYTLQYAVDDYIAADGKSVLYCNSGTPFSKTLGVNYLTLATVSFSTTVSNSLVTLKVKCINTGGNGVFSAKIMNSSNVEVWNSRMTNYTTTVE